MKLRTLVLLFVLVLVMAAPATAAGRETVGDKISIFFSQPDRIEFPAEEPFHISHGHGLEPGDASSIGVFDFALLVDDVVVDEDYVQQVVDRSQDIWFKRLWVYNFAEGMTGTHTFTAIWYAPCEWAVENGYSSGPCTKPNAKVVMSSNSVIIDFE